jgi:TonB family protein
MFFIRSTHLRVLPVLLCACGIIVSTPTSVNAQIRADQPTAFNIPAQPLDAALAQYFRVTGVQLLYDSTLTAGYRSAAVKGTYSPREALRLLLRGTGLVVRYSRANAAIITKPNAVLDSPLVPLGRVVVRERITTRIAPIERIAYYQQLEEEFQSRLRNDKRAGRMNFSIILQLAVDEDGKVNDLRIMRGSGDGKIDRMLLEILANAIVSPPPAGLVQPLAIALKGTRL